MPVRNVMPFLDAAIASILAQTHSEFEFLIRDDASTDGTAEKLDRWAQRDSRIKVFHGQRQLGPAASSNWIVAQSQGALIARMDGDDVSHPDRFRRQVEVLRAQSEVSLVGTLFRTIDANGAILRSSDRFRLKQPGPFAPFSHGSIMYRRSAFDLAGGYRNECNFWEDQDLYLRIARIGKVVVIPQILFDYRYNFTSTRLVSERVQVEAATDLCLRCLDAFAAKGDYEDILRNGVNALAMPRAIKSIGQLELWSHYRPKLFSRLLKHPQLGRGREALALLAWALWAQVHPSSLRLFTSVLAQVRESFLALWVPGDRLYAWPPPRKARHPLSHIADPVSSQPNGPTKKSPNAS